MYRPELINKSVKASGCNTCGGSNVPTKPLEFANRNAVRFEDIDSVEKMYLYFGRGSTEKAVILERLLDFAKSDGFFKYCVRRDGSVGVDCLVSRIIRYNKGQVTRRGRKKKGG